MKEIISLINENREQLTKGDIRLELLDRSHCGQLIEMAKELSIWLNHRVHYHEPDIFKNRWLAEAFNSMKSDKRIAFVVLYKNSVIGSSSYYELELSNKSMKMGYTWYNPFYWGKGVNPVVKLILLNYAFEILRFNRVAFSIDSENIRSRKAVEKLKIPFEGILKNDIVRPDNSLRSSAIYALTREVWPQTKSYLMQLISVGT